MQRLLDTDWLASEQPDALLLHTTSPGDDEAFRHFFERHIDAIRAYVQLRVRADARDDVIADTFATAWHNRARFRADADSARPWLFGIASMHAKQQMNIEGRWRRTAELDAATNPQFTDPDPSEAIAGATPLSRAVARLPQSEQEVLLLVAIGELRITEAAEILGISPVSARVRLHRARSKVSMWVANDGAAK